MPKRIKNVWFNIRCIPRLACQCQTMQGYCAVIAVDPIMSIMDRKGISCLPITMPHSTSQASEAVAVVDHTGGYRSQNKPPLFSRLLTRIHSWGPISSSWMASGCTDHPPLPHASVQSCWDSSVDAMKWILLAWTTFSFQKCLAGALCHATLRMHAPAIAYHNSQGDRSVFSHPLVNLSAQRNLLSLLEAWMMDPITRHSTLQVIWDNSDKLT